MTNHIKKVSIFIVLISFVYSACASNTWEENQKAIIGGAGGAAARCDGAEGSRMRAPIGAKHSHVLRLRSGEGERQSHQRREGFGT